MIDNLTAMLAAMIGGVLFGGIYFAWLWRSVSSLATAKRAAAGFLLGAVLRLTALAALVGALLWLGMAPLLLFAGGLGFFVARLAATTALTRPAREFQ